MGQAQDNEVQVRIGVEMSALKPGMEQGAQDVERAAAKMRDAVAQANESMSESLKGVVTSIGNVSGALSLMFGALAGGASFGSAIEETKKLTGEARSLSKALGITVQDASALNIALGDIYSSSESFIGASQMLSRQLRTNEGDLNAMGLKTRDANGQYRNMKDLMFDAIAVLRDYKEGTDRAMAAQTLFGRGGSEALSMLKLTSEAMADAKQKAEDLGLTVGEENVKALSDYKAAMNDLDDVISAAKKSIGDELLPHLTDLANWLSNTGPDAVNALRGQIETLGTVAIGTVLTGSIRAMSLRLADATTSLISTTQATRVAAAAKLEAAQATARSTAAIRDHAAMLLQEAEAAVVSATGMARLSVVTNTLIPARERLEAATRAASAAERALADAALSSSAVMQASGAVINALGGPLGAVISLLGIGATAWAAFGNSADDAKNAAKRANDEIDKGRDLLARYQREKKFGTGDEGQLRASLDAVERKISVLVQTSGSDAAAERLGSLRKEAEELQSALNDIESRKESPNIGKGYQPPPEKKKQKEESRINGWEADLSKKKAEFMEKNQLYEMALSGEKSYWDEILLRTDLSEKERGQIQKKSADLRLQLLKKSAQEGRGISAEELEKVQHDAIHSVDLQESAAQQLYALGKINKEELLSQEKAFEQARYDINYSAILERMALIGKDPNMNPVEYQKLLNQLLDLRRKHELDVKAIENKIEVDKASPFANIFKGLDSSFSQAANGILLRAQTLRQAIGGVFQSIASQAISETSKIAVKWVADEAKKTAATEAGAAARMGVEKMAAGESILANANASIAKIMADANEAAAAAYKAVVGIPVVGPALAPVAAGVAFGAVAAYRTAIPSAEGGWDIPAGATGLMRYHEREMMLPAEHADTIRSLKDGGVSRSLPNVSVNINAVDARGVKSLFMENKRELADAISAAVRDGHKGIGK